MKNTTKLIERFFNKHVKHEQKENVFIPAIQKTVYPKKRLSYDEVFENIYKQLKTNY